LETKKKKVSLFILFLKKTDFWFFSIFCFHLFSFFSFVIFSFSIYSFLQEGFFLLFNNNFVVFLARIFKEVEH